jgi:class 3 adenylate cyclase/HAMP domain-containing protein/MFS family permease
MYFNEESLTLFSLLFLNTTIIAYFLTLKPKNKEVWLLIFAFLGLETFYSFDLLVSSLPSLLYWKFLLRQLQLLPAIVSASFLVSFFYFFPENSPEYKKERVIVSYLLIFINLFAASLSLYAIYYQLDFNSDSFLIQLALVLILVILIVATIIRRGLIFKRKKEAYLYNSIRSFLNPFYLIILSVSVEILFVMRIVPERIEVMSNSLGLLGFHFLFALSYINHTKQKTSFMAKIIGITIVTIFFMWGNLGHILAPQFKDAFRNEDIIKKNTMLSFFVNQKENYDIKLKNFDFNFDLGEEVAFQENDSITKELIFPFLFFGKQESHIQIMRSPLLVFGENVPINFDIGIFEPTIYVTGLIAPVLNKNGKVYLNLSETKAVITWFELMYNEGIIPTSESITVQLTLYKNGDFTMAYKELPQNQYFPLSTWGTSFDFVGITPGNKNSIKEIHFSKDLPFSGEGKTGIGESFYLRAKQYSHNRVLPLVQMLFGIGLFTVFVFPFFFSINLINPLKNLVDGIGQVNLGKLEANVEPEFNDEIGFLTRSFNGMVDFVRDSDALKQKFIGDTELLNAAYHKFFPEQFLSFIQKKSILDIQLGDFRQMQMTILFSDIRSYTNLSEKMSPEENFKFLNSYLERVGPVIRKHNGFIDKYIGDAIMALFPNKVDDAVNCAIEMQRVIENYNEERLQWNKAPISAGIGIHTGDVIIGTIGENQRMEGTVVSDAVNISSRLENLTKFYSSKILISMESLLEMENQTDFNFRILDKVKVKGKERFTSVVEILDGYDEEKLNNLLKTKIHFEQGLAFYIEKEFANAIKSFHKVIRLVSDDKASKIYIQRAEFYLKNGVPVDWNGVEVIDHKYSD